MNSYILCFLNPFCIYVLVYRYTKFIAIKKVNTGPP